MNRSLKLSILVALTLSSTQALALGLGQIHVKSALNKPLVAEIPLRTDYPGEADNLKVALASADQFSRAGLDRMSLTVQLKFKVTTNASGQKVIRVTSAEPVRETFLDFLVRVTWPRGQLLREYTVLLDPPGSMATARLQGAVAPAPAVPAPPAPAPAPAPRQSAKAAPAVPAAQPARPRASAPAPTAQIQNGNYGPVAAGQTLWGIARRQHPEGVSVNQMMLALKLANPDAFYKDNINALKRGAVLRIPTRDEALARTAAAATAEVLRQDHAWSAIAPTRPTTVTSTGQPMAKRPSASGKARRAGTAHPGDKLVLVPPSQGGQSTGARPGVAGGSAKVSVDQMQQDMARAREALSSARQQTADLQAHLKSLKDIQDKNDRLLSLKNAEIAELQNKLAAAGKPAPGASSGAPAMTASAPATATSVAMSSSAKMPVAASSSAAASVPSTARSANKPAAAPRVKPASKQAPGTPWYEPLWVKVSLAAGLIVLLLLFLRSKRKPKGSPMAGAGASLADQFSEGPFGGAEAGEAHDQEQDDLLHELAENPEDVGLHLELVSLYYARRDVERFESAAEAMRTHISDPQQPEWQDVVTMGEELSPDYPLFAFAEEPGTYAPDIPEDDDEVASPGSGTAPMPQTAPPEYEATPSEDVHAEHDDTALSASAAPHDFDLTEEDDAFLAPSEDEYDALPPREHETPATIEPEEPVLHAPEPEADQDDPLDTLDLDTPLAFDAETHEDAAPAAAGPGMGGDAVDTKIDLARAYMDMGDPEGARSMLEEVMHEGSQAQRDAAQKLLDELG